MVNEERIHRVSDAHTVDQNDRIDGEKVSKSNEVSASFTKMFFNRVSDVCIRIFCR
ncbi:Uncharacterised protein [Vibrio cholerae]|nr:Uncharacterised protein [Vibrio cholerae]CSI77579.1 Uncharacterised protein [Vibrio cholerae]